MARLQSRFISSRGTLAAVLSSACWLRDKVAQRGLPSFTPMALRRITSAIETTDCTPGTPSMYQSNLSIRVMFSYSRQPCTGVSTITCMMSVLTA